MSARNQPSAADRESSKDRLTHLTDAVESLAEDIRVLTAAIDDIRQELEWTVKSLCAQKQTMAGTRPTEPPSAAASPQAPTARSKATQAGLF